MPKIPTIQADETIRSGSASPHISPNAFGAGSGEALESLGETITTAIYHQNDINNEIQAHKSISEAQGELSDFQQYLKTGPTNDGTQVDKSGIPYPVGSPQMDPATGLPVGPPPPEKHAELMQEKVEEMKNRYGGDFGALGGSARRMFNANFDNYANAQLLETKAHAIARMNQSIDENLRTDLQTRANLAVNADPLVRHTSESETEQYIDSMVKRGVITPEQGAQRKDNFVHQVELGTIRNIMKAPLRNGPGGDGGDGATDLIKAIDNGEFNKLPADVLQRNREMAINQHAQNLKQIDLAEQHETAAVEKQRRETDRDNALKLSVAYTKGTLTPAQVTSLAQRKMISPETALTYGKLAAGGDNIPSNRDVKIDLLNRVFNGEDVTEQANSAAQHRDLNPNDYAEIRKLQGEYSNTFKANPGAKQAFDWVHGQMGGDALTKLPSQNAAEANVKRELHEYMRTNPKASPDEMMDYAGQLVKRASIFDKDTMTSTMLSPRFYKGSKATLTGGSATMQDMQDAYNQTVAAEKAGKINAVEAKREKALIAQWTTNLNLTPKAPTAPVKK